MHSFQKTSELNKTLNRFNKIRLYHTYGYMNILPIKYLKMNSSKYRQLQLNTDTHFNAIIMDIDDESLLTEWNVVGLPTPTIQTLNKHNDKAHLIWLLNVPVSKKNKKAVKYYKDIVDSIKLLIGSDKAYQNHQTKNFLNENLYRVTYNDISYNLADFKSYIIRAESSRKPYNFDTTEYESTGSRHIDLFNQLRLYGYRIANDKNLENKLQTYAELINEQFENPIKPKAIVKSVLQFCEENRNNFKIAKNYNIGVMKFKKITKLSYTKYLAEVLDRQKASSLRTSLIKRLKTTAKIKVALKILDRLKIKCTQINIAKETELSLSTIKRYSKIINTLREKTDGLISSIRVIVLEAEEQSIKPIKYYNEVKDICLRAPT